MPLSYQTHSVSSSASGSGLQFSVTYSFLLKAHVKLYYGLDILAGTSTSLLVDGVDYNWTSSTQVTLTSAPSSNQTLTIIRDTPDSTQQVVWQDGSNLIADDMNTADRQNLFVVQEQQDRNDLAATKAIDSETASNAATTAVNQAVLADGTRAMTGNLNVNSNKVVNLANPTAGGDAVNKTFADATYQPLDAELTELATMASNTAAALADLTQAEVNILDGATISTSELNTLDGVTASTAELNKLDGVTSSTAELNILDGVTATASELNALDGITASTAELNKLDGVTASTAELNTVDGVTSAIQTQLDGKQPLDAELTELATMQSTTASALADLTQAEVQVLDGATLSTAELNKLDGVTSTTTELNILDGVTATTTELNVTDGLTASTSELNQLDGKTISSTLTPANTNDIPTSSAVNTFVSGLLNALGGFVAIPNETSFPTTNPDPSDNAGTVVSIADAGGVVVDANGASTTGRTTGNVTVTITGFPTSLQSTTLGAGLGLQVQTTTTLNTYTYHKLIAKEADVKQLSDDINDFQARYRVSDNAPTTDLDEGDLWYDKTANKMKVYDTSTSAWKEVQSVGSFFINTLSSSSGTGGGSATFNGSAYRFTLSNAGASAQQMLVSVNGVIQKPNSGTSQPSEGFAIQNNDIIFAAAPASGASHFIVTIGSTVNVGQPSANTVDTSELVDGAVTNAKVSSSAAIAGTKISPNFGSQNVVTTGRIGIGTTSASQPLDIVTSGADAYIRQSNGTVTGFVGVNNNNSAFDIYTFSNHPTRFFTNNTERLRINTSGRLLVGTTTTSVHGDRLIEIGNTSRSATFQAITTSTSGTGGIVFADTTTNDTGGYRGSIQYDHSNDSLKLNTAATERLRINSSGNVGIGIQNPSSKLHVNGTAKFDNYIHFGGVISTPQTAAAIYRPADNQLAFSTSNSERIRIDNSGRLLCGTSSDVSGGLSTTLIQGVAAGGGFVGLARNDTSVFNGSGIGGLRFYTNDPSGYNDVGIVQCIADGTHDTDDYPTRLEFHTTADNASSPTERLRIDSAGRVGIGETSMDGLLVIKGDSNASSMPSIRLKDGTDTREAWISNASGDLVLVNGGTDNVPHCKITMFDGNIMTFETANTERVRIDQDGGLGVGVTNPSQYHANANDIVLANGMTIANTGAAHIYFADSASGTGEYVGQLNYNHYNDYMQFVVKNAERLRINDLGFIKAGPRIADSSHGVASLTSARHEFTSDNNGWTIIVTHTSGAASEHEGILIDYENSPNGTGNSFIQGNDSNGLKFRFASNGGLYNYQGNNSNLSDQREKKNIVNLETKWDKVKSWDLKKFHYNEDADSDSLRYGVIAQQVEEHCPEVLTEWIKQPAKDAVLDEDGNVVTPAVAEVTRKGVKEQQMMWMAIKALQEAQTRIESLETQNASLEARLTALEGAS